VRALRYRLTAKVDSKGEVPVFEHFMAVRKSNLYEYGGCRKSLLAQIAYLIIGPRDEDAQGKPIGEPDPAEGWCVATQATLASMIGCSAEEACREISEFVRDGWLTKKEFIDKRGHKRCHYTITPKQLKAIEAREMRKYPEGHPEEGEYIRAKFSSAKRGDKSRLNLLKAASGKRSHHKKLEAPLDEPSISPLTNRQEAPRRTVNKPLDEPSSTVVDSGVVVSSGSQGMLLKASSTSTPSHPTTEPKATSKAAGNTSLPQATPVNRVSPRERCDNFEAMGCENFALGSSEFCGVCLSHQAENRRKAFA
jgi:hypothetical protein